MSKVAKPVNIAVVAAEAGVGVGTVSRVLNASPQVSEPTRRRVLEVISRLRYQPSRLASGLARGTTCSVAVLVPRLTRPSVVERLAGAIRVLDEEGYDTVVFNVETAQQRERHLAALTLKHRADGIIVISLPLDKGQVKSLQSAGVPVVMVDADSPGLPRFIVDDVAGGRMATEHLLALGHRRIAFVGDESDPALAFTSTAYRCRGYREALRGAGVSVDAGLLTNTSHERSGAPAGVEAAWRLIEAADPPTAVFAASDTQAMGVVHAVEQHGLKVPEDLSVVGFDDIEAAELIQLTTIRQPLQGSGAQAARHLCARLRGEHQRTTRTVMPLELIDRASTGPLDRRGRPPPRRIAAMTTRRGAANVRRRSNGPSLRGGRTGGTTTAHR